MKKEGLKKRGMKLEPKSAAADEIGRFSDQLIPKSAAADEIGRLGNQT